MIAWALTYLLHSTVLIVLAWAVARAPWGRSPRIREGLWKSALLGALLTATLHQATDGSASLAPRIRLSELPAAALQAPVESGWSWILLVWGAGSGLAAARLIGGWLRLRRVTGRRRVLARGALRRDLDAMLMNAGVTRRITLSCSRGLTVPRAIGGREICVPIRALRELTPSELRALVAHETAHLLRHDGAWLFVAAVVQTLGWWQPLTRLAVASLRQSMELCCDDWAASRLPDRVALAECLVKVGEWGVVSPGDLPLAALIGRGSPLRERVERLMEDDCPGRRASRTLWLAAVPLLAVFAFAPRVTLAETTLMPALVAPALLRVEAVTRAAPDPDPVTPAPMPVVRTAKSGTQARRSPAPAIDSAASEPETARVEEPSSSHVGAPTSAVIMMAEPLIQPASSLRVTSRAVQALPLAPARPQPNHVFAQADRERRVGLWLESQRRSPPFDPLHPKYDVP